MTFKVKLYLEMSVTRLPNLKTNERTKMLNQSINQSINLIPNMKSWGAGWGAGCGPVLCPRPVGGTVVHGSALVMLLLL